MVDTRVAAFRFGRGRGWQYRHAPLQRRRVRDQPERQERHASGEFLAQYSETREVASRDLFFHTSIGPVGITVHDVPGRLLKDMETFDAEVAWAHAVLVFHDHTSVASVSAGHAAVIAAKAHLSPLETKRRPVVLCASFFDERPKMLEFSFGVPYFQISSNYNFEKPFLEVIRRCLDDPALVLADAIVPALVPRPKDDAKDPCGTVTAAAEACRVIERLNNDDPETLTAAIRGLDFEERRALAAACDALSHVGHLVRQELDWA